MGVVVDHWWSWNWWTTYWVGAQLWQSFQSLFRVTEYNSFTWIVIISLVVFFQGLKRLRPQEWMKKNRNGAWILTFLKVSCFETKMSNTICGKVSWLYKNNFYLWIILNDRKSTENWPELFRTLTFPWKSAYKDLTSLSDIERHFHKSTQCKLFKRGWMRSMRTGECGALLNSFYFLLIDY